MKLSLHQELAHDVVEIGNEAIKQYWKSSMLGQLMFRPFLHWWDKNLVDILQTPFSETNETTERNHSSTDNDSDVVCEEDIQESVQPLIKSKRGTEIRFIGLDVGQSLGTAFWTSVKIVISCERCKNPQEIEVKEERLAIICSMNMFLQLECVILYRLYSVVCGRCSNSMCVLYHLALIHSASSTLGYLELTRFVYHVNTATKTSGTISITRLRPGQGSYIWLANSIGQDIL